MERQWVQPVITLTHDGGYDIIWMPGTTECLAP